MVEMMVAVMVENLVDCLALSKVNLTVDSLDGMSVVMMVVMTVDKMGHCLVE